MKTKLLSAALVGLAVLLGTYQRIQTGTLDTLQKFDPYEHFHLARHWLNEGEYMAQDALLFPNPSGQQPSVGYPPLTHFEPAAITQALNAVGQQTTLVEVMAFLPVVIMALATIAMYFLGREIYGARTGVIAALLTATFPPFIEVGRAGAYDTNLHLFLFTILTLALFARSLNQTVRRKRLYWGALGGLSIGLYALHWRGYVMFAGFLGLTIVLYTGFASVLDELQPETTYSFIGVLAATPVMAYWYVPSGNMGEIYGVIAVGLLAFLPLVAHRFPSFAENRLGISNGQDVRRYVSVAALAVVVFTVFYAVQYGSLPGGFSVPGLGMFDTSGSFRATIAELQSPFATGNPLRSSFGVLGQLILPVTVLPIGLIMYKLSKDFHPKRVLELTFLLLSLIMMFKASRFVEIYVVVVTLTLSGLFSFIIDIKSVEDTSSVVVVVVLVLLTAPAMPMIQAGGPGKMQSTQPGVTYESNGAWVSTFEHMNQSPEFNKSTAVMSWWDYGFPAKALANVQYVSDNTQVNIEVPAKFYVMQNLSDGHQFLTEGLREERGEDVDYVVGNKYLGFSGKWSGVVTVASTSTDMDAPNLFDDAEGPGEEEWMFSSEGIGSKAAGSNYYGLAFYNVSRYGVGDEPYPGYEIVYQSPQWYVGTERGLATVEESRIDEFGFSDSQVVGPAITVYRVED